MILRTCNLLNETTSTRKCRRCSGWTLMEIMVVVGLMVVVMALLSALSLYALKSFAALGNYVSLERNSRSALDTMTKEIRQADALLDFANKNGQHWLKFTNATKAAAITYEYLPAARVLTVRTNSGPASTNLTGCDRWDFGLYIRAPLQTNGSPFVPTANPKDVKMVSMSWKCSRTVLGKTWNSETVQTAQIVLRNKQYDDE